MNTTNSSFNTPPPSPSAITYKQLVETIALVTTELVVMTDRAIGLDPTLDHMMSTAEFCDILKEQGVKITQRERIQIGTSASAQARLAKRPQVVVERIFETSCGLRKKIKVLLHAQESMARAADALGLI